MIFFHADTVEIYDEIFDSEKCGTDQYDKPLKCLQLRFIVEGDLQSTSPSESNRAFGTKTSNSHKLYLDIDVDVENSNILKIHGYKGVFKIVGDPEVFDKLIPHQLVSLRHISEERRVCI